jgi:assimilatory nitrate reductase catalytic subunit
VHDDGGAPLARISALSMAETEPAVCACFGVGEGCIRDAVASGKAGSVTEIGQMTRAGTNCGSCLPELKRMVAQERAKLRTKDPVT